MAGASARCGAEDAGIATLEVDSGRSCSRRRTSSPAIFEVQGDRFRSYSMFQNLNSAKAYSKSFLKMVSNTVRVLWLLRESVLTSVQRPANPAVEASLEGSYFSVVLIFASVQCEPRTIKNILCYMNVSATKSIFCAIYSSS